MYSETDRTYIRTYVGYGAIFLQAEPRLENAVTATQSVADGGGRPDSSTENIIKILLYGGNAITTLLPTPGPLAQNIQFSTPQTFGLVTIDQQLSAMWPITFAMQADNGEAKIDTFRGMIQLRSEGRRMANRLARMLGMKGVRADMFSPGCPVIDNDPFMYSDLESWQNPVARDP